MIITSNKNGTNIASLLHGLSVHEADKPTVIESSVDPLATSWRYYQNRNNLIENIGLAFAASQSNNQAQNRNELSEHDFIVANQIRDYYTKRAIIWQLKERGVTEFRVKLIKFLTECVGPQWRYSSDYEGLLYRLPEFYDYDRQLDQLADTHFTNTDFSDIEISKPHTMSLRPLKMLRRDTRGSRGRDYWFEYNGRGVVLRVRVENNLLHMWNSYFNRAVAEGSTIDIYATKISVNTHYTEFPHLVLSNKWELIT